MGYVPKSQRKGAEKRWDVAEQIESVSKERIAVVNNKINAVLKYSRIESLVTFDRGVDHRIYAEEALSSARSREKIRLLTEIIELEEAQIELDSKTEKLKLELESS